MSKIDTKEIRELIVNLRNRWSPKYAEETFKKLYLLIPDLCNAYDELQKENARLREALEWQPISTAPKDGTKIYLYWDEPEFIGDNQLEPHCAFWSKDHWVSTGSQWIGKDLPTHWMPLPEPPEAEEE